MVLLDGYVGRIVAEVVAPRISDVHIDRITVAVHLPHARYLDRIPRRVVVVHGVEVRGALVGILDPVEAPSAVERHAIGVVLVAICALRGLGRVEDLVIGVHRGTVDLVYLRVVPLREGLRTERYGRQGSQKQ